MNSCICSSLLKREHNSINGTDAAEAIVGSFKYTLARRSASETAFAALSLVCLASTVRNSAPLSKYRLDSQLKRKSTPCTGLEQKDSYLLQTYLKV